jgi:ParB family chromosome partitioning protein
MTNLCEIELTKISPNPKNPRRHFDKHKIDELAASIKQKGVIEPIIVRSFAKKNETRILYEIVVGERRYKAATAAGLAAIPAIVRDLTDDEAYDFMLIENLQRDDLTDREEAESFKAYVKAHGEGAEAALAEKTGIAPAYIRGRIRILELPARILKAWDQGKFVFGHLQQLLRVVDDEKKLKEKIEWLEEQSRWEERTPTVRDLRDEIDGDAPALSSALFKSGETCRACPSNSTVQKSLFDVEAKNALCLNSECFKKRQAEWLTENWKTTAIAKKNKTNGFRFREDVGYDGCHDFNEWGRRPGKKCSICPNFVSVIDLAGRERDDRACAGEKSCYEAVTNPKSAKEKATGERDPEAPRAAWHGEAFRNKFLKRRIPERVAGEAMPQLHLLALFFLAHENEAAFEAVATTFGHATMTRAGTGADKVLLKILTSPEKTEELTRLALAAIAKEGQDLGEYGGIGSKHRMMVADFLKINLAKEFSVDKEYLNLKTKAELYAFIRKQSLLKDEKVRLYWEKKISVGYGCVESLKKQQLVDLILKSGVDLVGKVPAEILK